MNSIETLGTFFGWCTVINIGIMLFVLSIATVFHEAVGKVHAALFGVTQENAKATLFCVFQQYRIAVLVLNLVPYLALEIMG